MILASHQPNFFPYMGLFFKLYNCDMFVFSDNVQYSKSGMHNYNLILTAKGPMKLTLPIHYHVANLNEIRLAADGKWVDKTIKTLWMEYRRSEHFHEAFPVIEDLLLTVPMVSNLAVFNEGCIMRLCDLFGLKKDRDFVLSSGLPLKERRDARIIEMCKLLGAKEYLSGDGAKDYHVEEDYRRNGIQLLYTDYQPVEYRQTAGERFAENMSVIDYVMNCGFELPRGWKK